MASIVDVARAAGVTPSVVSRLLNEDPALRVRAETRQRVLTAARELEYTPNHAARALRRSRVGTLGLAVLDISNPVYSAIIEGAQHAASTSGYVVLLADVAELARDNDAFGRVVRSGAIDGLLLLRAGNRGDRMVAKIASSQVPTVLINDRSRTLGSVAVDDRAGARLATTHLLELGHRRIAMLRLDGRFSRARDRVTGWQNALAAHGVEPNAEHLVDGGHTAETGHAGMQALLTTRPRPTAVVASSVLAAVGALTAISEAGLSVPDDVSVVGFHDVFFAEHLTPALTVVKLNLRGMGEVAVGSLLEQLDGGPARHVVVTEPAPELVLRDSTAPPAR
jgi:LacI family transcriptional regulator